MAAFHPKADAGTRAEGAIYPSQRRRLASTLL
jgi:hypothetical protein